MSSKVYFTREISPEKVLEVYKLLGAELKGKVAVKVHSGEVGNQNFLRPPFWKPVVDYVGGTVVECNTAYDGERNTTKKHLKAIKKHGWNDYFDFDLLDAEGPDLVFDIPSGKVIKKNFVGKNLKNYDSMLVLSHFKGHPMGGYGGALKQLSIGCASSYGKAYIHGSGDIDIAVAQPALVYRLAVRTERTEGAAERDEYVQPETLALPVRKLCVVFIFKEKRLHRAGQPHPGQVCNCTHKIFIC